MDTKLTLSVNKDIVDRAKKYAQRNNISLSKLIEDYLNNLTSGESEEEYISPLVKSLSGVIKVPKNFDLKNGYRNYLRDKI